MLPRASHTGGGASATVSGSAPTVSAAWPLLVPLLLAASSGRDTGCTLMFGSSDTRPSAAMAQ